MVMSLLGHYNNFFFAAHLLDIAMGVKTLRTILSSVTHNGKQVWRGPAGACEPGRGQLGGLSRGGGVRLGHQTRVGVGSEAPAGRTTGLSPGKDREGWAWGEGQAEPGADLPFPVPSW